MATGSRRVPVRRRSPPSSASSPRPRTKTRFWAESTRSRFALKAGAVLRAAASFWSAASRARTAGGGAIWRVPGSGWTAAGSRSGTESSNVTKLTRPATRGNRASAPSRVRSRSAIALTRSLDTSWRAPAANAQGAREASLRIDRDTPFRRQGAATGVFAVRRSMVTASPLPTKRPWMSVSRMPCSASLKEPPASVARPSTRGSLIVPESAASTSSLPVTRCPVDASATLASAASTRPLAVNCSDPAASKGTRTGDGKLNSRACTDLRIDRGAAIAQVALAFAAAAEAALRRGSAASSIATGRGDSSPRGGSTSRAGRGRRRAIPQGPSRAARLSRRKAAAP